MIDQTLPGYATIEENRGEERKGKGMNTDAECRATFAVVRDALRDTGEDAYYILRNVAMADDGVQCVAGLYNKETNRRTEVIVDWTPDRAALRERFRLGLSKA